MPFGTILLALDTPFFLYFILLNFPEAVSRQHALDLPCGAHMSHGGSPLSAGPLANFRKSKMPLEPPISYPAAAIIFSQ